MEWEKEMTVLRANILGGMDAYIRETVQDEEDFEYWLIMGIPDGATEETLMEIAKDEAEFTRIAVEFGHVCKWGIIK